MTSVAKKDNDPMPADLFEMNWQDSFQMHRDVEGLDSVVDFDKFVTKDHASVNPRLTMEKPLSPRSEQSNFTENFQHNPSVDDELDKLFRTGAEEGNVSQSMELFDLPQPMRFNELSVQSMESPVSHVTSVLNQFRRSISEPPTGSPHNLPVDPGAPVQPGITFHRDSQYLGQPMGDSMFKLKTVPKAKQHRQQPYARKIPPPSRVKRSDQLIHSSSPPFQYYLQLPGGCTQRQVSRSPTSAPSHTTAHTVGVHQGRQQPVMSSRICSPTPRSPIQADESIDPMLQALVPKELSSSQSSPTMPLKQVVHIQLPAEQLQQMITKAVRDAIGIGTMGSTFAKPGVAAADEHDNR